LGPKGCFLILSAVDVDEKLTHLGDWFIWTYAYFGISLVDRASERRGRVMPDDIDMFS
jgi:hypothetical protein